MYRQEYADVRELENFYDEKELYLFHFKELIEVIWKVKFSLKKKIYLHYQCKITESNASFLIPEIVESDPLYYCVVKFHFTPSD